jgi:hypothetical protein
MAGENSNIQVTDLDFNLIKTNLKRYLQSQTTLQDYNYEGSALSTLLDILAYNTQYQAYYLNMVANEMFLDSALQRASVVSHAKLLNYTPQSASAPKAEVNLVMNNVTDSSLTLPIFTSFLSEAIDGVTYKFVTMNSITENTNLENNTVTYNNLVIKQGEPVTLTFTYDSGANPTAIFELPDTDVDTTTITVTVQQSGSNTSTQVFTLVDDYLSLDNETTAYFLQEGNNGFYQIYFGDGILGKALTDGNVITISYIITSGTLSSGANSFVLMDTISGFSNGVVTPVLAATQGAEKETIESIKYTAPKSYSAQGRAVTKEDYIFLIQNNSGVFPIDAVNVWGGEENDPPVYGAIFVAIKPSGGFLLTQTQKAIIEEQIIKPISVLTVQPRIIDVDYTYLVINSNILYEPKLTSLTSSQLQTQVLTAIQGFARDTLNTFNSTFKLSSLISTVQAVSGSFVTNDASITLQKRIVPSLTSSTTYSLKFGTPLKKDIFGKSISATPTFQIIDTNNNNVVRDTVYLEETPSSTTTVESISVLNPGFGYTSTPIVTILGDGVGATAVATVVNGQINNITVTNSGGNYTQAIVQITPTDGNGALASGVAVLSGNQGTLRTYYFEDGVKRILNSNAGTVNYADGIVTLTDFNPSAINNPLGILSVQAIPTSTIISSARDKIITLDNTDPNAINVNIIAKV